MKGTPATKPGDADLSSKDLGHSTWFWFVLLCVAIASAGWWFETARTSGREPLSRNVALSTDLAERASLHARLLDHVIGPQACPQTQQVLLATTVLGGAGLAVLVLFLLRVNRRLQQSRNEVARAFAEAEAHALLVAASGDAIVGTTPRGLVTSWNPSAETLYGLTRRHVLGKPLPQLVQPDSPEALDLLLRKAWRGGTIRVEAARHRAGDGTVRDVALAIAPTRRSDGIPLGLSVVIRDISARKHAERALRRNEAVLESTFQALPDRILVLDRDLRIVRSNIPDPEVSAGETADRGPRHCYTCLYQRDVPCDDCPVREVFRTGAVAEREKMDRTGTRSLVCRAFPIRDEKGRVEFAVECIRDVTEERNATAALQSNEERLTLALNEATDGLWDWNVRTNEVYFSPRYQTMLGYDPGELAPSFATWETLLHPADRERARETVAAAIKRRESFEIEFRLMHKDGTPRWILSRGTIVASESGRPVRVVGTHLDITERKRRVAALTASEARFRALARHFPKGAVHMFDHDLRFTLAEGSVLDKLGLVREAMVGHRVEDFLPPSVCRELIPHYRATLAGRTDNFEIALGGEIFDVHTLPIRDEDGNVLGGAVISQIVTEWKEARAERERLIRELSARNAEMEHFAYTVSHDLRSPLITIKGFLGRMASDLEKKEYARLDDRMRRVAGAADKMQELLDGVLELSRIGRIVSTPEDLPLDPLVRETLTLLQGPLETRGVRVDIRTPLPVVRGDPVRIREVFQNLIENAVKYMGEQAAPRIEIAGEARDGEAVLRIRDNGRGLDPAYLETIFGLFDQIDPAEEGTGVGLALVRRIVELHGGAIHAESEGRGRGSTFVLTLPLAASRQAPPTRSRASSTARVSGTAG